MDFPPENIKDRIADSLTDRRIRESILLKSVIGVVLLVSAAVFFPNPDYGEYVYEIGTIWTDKDLVAPFAFPVYKEEGRYERDVQESVRSVYPVYERDVEAQIRSIDSAKSVVRRLQRVAELQIALEMSRRADDSVLYREALRMLPFGLSNNELESLKNNFNRPEEGAVSFFPNLDQSVMRHLKEIYRSGVIDGYKSNDDKPKIALREGPVEEIVPVRKFYTREGALNVIASRLEAGSAESEEPGLAFKIIGSVLKPNLLLNQQATDQAVRDAADNVPRTIGYVLENERVIRMYERVTEEIKLKLDSFRRARTERNTDVQVWRYWAGAMFHVATILCLFALYLNLFRKEIFTDNGRLTIIAVLIIMEMFFTYLSLRLDLQVPLQYLVLAPAASMLLAIIFDSRVAFYGTVAFAFIIAGLRGNDYDIAFSSIVAGMLGVYSVRDISNRTQIFRSIIFIFIGYVISILALSFGQMETLPAIAVELTLALASAVFSSVLAYGLLIIFERGFKVATDLTLVGLSDFNHPLLVEFSEKAPGTFHHSVSIGNMAEAAAEAIGANAILARAGGYYHDIGKILKPEYFVENQVGPHSRHARLKPRMSALIISSHVREGIELARDRGLPENVIEFITQHHGTTRISFFYDKALKLAAKKPQKNEIKEEDFLYPGPKPQTKETGIVMLADSVEATVRSMTEVTPQKLETAIDNMIKHRFMEGQLDESDLTLRDLTMIREAFLKILIGLHHPRIKYPERESVVQDPQKRAETAPVLGAVTVPAEQTDQGKKMPEGETAAQKTALPDIHRGIDNKEEDLIKPQGPVQ